jgi:RNA polymerase sigma factor (sigma-70 family)
MRSDPTQDTLATRAGVLFEQFRTGNEAMMGDLIALVTPILWHTVRAQNLDPTSSEDVVQTTWFALVRSADAVADSRAVLQWLIVTAKREAWRVARVDRRAEPQELNDDAIVTAADASPEAVVVRGTGNDALWGHIAQLPQRCRELLRVIAFADRPDYAAIAESLGMPVGSIGPTRGRCLAKLRAQLEADPQWEI